MAAPFVVAYGQALQQAAKLYQFVTVHLIVLISHCVT